jgi:type VI protein secretion system component VasF
MKLLEYCDSFFLYACVLNRIAKLNERGVGYEYDDVRSSIERILAEMHSKAAGDLGLQEQVRKIELPLIFFVDSLISESRLGFASQWNSERLAFKRNEYAGDNKFFELLDETLQEATLRDKAAEASERLAVFYICLGLGFRGHGISPKRLRQYLDDIGRHISSLINRSWDEKLIPDQFADSTNLVEPPSRKLVLIGILFICFTLATAIAYIWMFREGSRSLSDSITFIIKKGGQ